MGECLTVRSIDRRELETVIYWKLISVQLCRVYNYMSIVQIQGAQAPACSPRRHN